MMVAVKLGRLVLVGLYAGYLIHVGLAMLLLPWTAVWTELVLRLPGAVAAVAASPSFRGALSAFGLLHIVLAAAEAGLPATVRRRL
jgi:hypothetical protein